IALGGEVLAVEIGVDNPFDRLAAMRPWPLGDGRVVAGDEFRRSRLAFKPRATAPSVVVDARRTVREPLAGAVNPFERDAHYAWPPTGRRRQPAAVTHRLSRPRSSRRS